MTAPVRPEIQLDDPVFSAACVALILVSIAWVLVVRMIARNLGRGGTVPLEPLNARDVWKLPPGGSGATRQPS